MPDSPSIAEVVADVPRPTPRTCPGCDQTDTDPHHVTGAVVDDQPPPGWHHDCHAAVGCRVCIEIVRAAGGVTGDAMLAAKIALQPDTPYELADGRLVHATPTNVED